MIFRPNLPQFQLKICDGGHLAGDANFSRDITVIADASIRWIESRLDMAE
jgi:hypothetical protein